jgi:phosphonate transport system ATP-binding protein
MAEAPALELSGATVRFGPRTALADVDLRVAAGEQVALIGPSGAGKSSALALMNTTLAPAAGRVRVLGRDPATLTARELRALRARIGTVHQSLDLVGSLRVLHNVRAGRLGHRSTWRALGELALARAPADVRSALERLDLADRLHERTERLSGGERQRVAVARTLVQRPELLLADEPVAHVDPARRRDVLELLRSDCAARGATLVASLHDVESALAHFPRVVGLRAGRVVFDLPAAEVSAQLVAALYRIERAAVA